MLIAPGAARPTSPRAHCAVDRTEVSGLWSSGPFVEAADAGLRPALEAEPCPAAARVSVRSGCHSLPCRIGGDRRLNQSSTHGVKQRHFAHARYA